MEVGGWAYPQGVWPWVGWKGRRSRRPGLALVEGPRLHRAAGPIPTERKTGTNIPYVLPQVWFTTNSVNQCMKPRGTQIFRDILLYPQAPGSRPKPQGLPPHGHCHPPEQHLHLLWNDVLTRPPIATVERVRASKVTRSQELSRSRESLRY